MRQGLFWLVSGLVAVVGQANLVLDWNGALLDGVRSGNSSPPLATRNLAILNLALYDAVGSVIRTHQPYQRWFPTPADTSYEAAAAGAGYQVLRVLYPGEQARTEERFAAWRRTVTNTAAITNGLGLGRTVAEALLAAREGDGSTTEIPYIPNTAPGQWRRTPPYFRPPLAPHWRYVRPFAIPGLEPFVPGPPPALDSAAYARDLEEVRSRGAAEQAARTVEESLVAVFWSDFSYTGMPPGHWHEIAAGIVRDRGTSLADTARLMALLSLAQADAAIVCWEAKYRYHLWRPVTAIQRADEDGHPETAADPGWNSYLGSPPFPAYPSGHSTFSGAAATVLAGFYGTDTITFTAASDSLPGVFRTFHSLAACADEVGLSRILGGIHFAFDDRAGKSSGRQVGGYVLANYLLPDQNLPRADLERVTLAEVVVRVQARDGIPFTLESSTDLVTWSPLAAGIGRPGGIPVLDVVNGSALRFYRVREE